MKPLLTAFLFLLTLSCTKNYKTEDPNILCGCEPQYMDLVIEFGTSYGLCAGNECNTTYIFDQDKLTKVTQSANGTNKIATVVNTKKYGGYSIYTLIPPNRIANYFPNKDTSYGCPDCVDQGATIYRVMLDHSRDTVVNLTFDNDLKSNPDSLQPFIQHLWGIMDSINAKN